MVDPNGKIQSSLISGISLKVLDVEGRNSFQYYKLKDRHSDMCEIEEVRVTDMEEKAVA